LDVAVTFNTLLVKGLLYKLTVHNFPSYLLKILSSYLDCRTLQTSFKTATSMCRVMRAGVAQGGIVCPVLFSLYVNDIPTPSRHVELAQYADDTALIAMFRAPSLLLGYLEAYLGNWSCRFGTVGSLSTSGIAQLCSLPRPREASDSPGQCNVSESQFSGSQLSALLG
jgi:hypothetical protein